MHAIRSGAGGGLLMNLTIMGVIRPLVLKQALLRSENGLMFFSVGDLRGCVDTGLNRITTDTLKKFNKVTGEDVQNRLARCLSTSMTSRLRRSSETHSTPPSSSLMTRRWFWR